MAAFDRPCMTYYQSAVVTIALSCIISEITRDIGRKSQFSYPCIRHSRQGIIAGTTAIRFAVEKLEWCGYQTGEQTEGRTDILRQHIFRAMHSIAR